MNWLGSLISLVLSPPVCRGVKTGSADVAYVDVVAGRQKGDSDCLIGPGGTRRSQYLSQGVLCRSCRNFLRTSS
jgi:hypothetical protein